MTPRTLTRSLDDRSFWRRILVIAHPDRNDGDGELFLFLTALREHVQACTTVELPRRLHDHRDHDRDHQRDRIPYDPGLGAEHEFWTLTHCAVAVVGHSVEEP